MRSPGIIVVAVSLLCPGASVAQSPATFAASDRVAIDRMLDGYSKLLSAGDYATLRKQVFQVPFIRFAAGMEVFTTLDEVEALFMKLLSGQQARGVVGGEFVRTQVVALAADRALVNKIFRRSRKDGSVVEDAAFFYIVSKSSGTWKLCGIVNQDLNEFGKIH